MTATSRSGPRSVRVVVVAYGGAEALDTCLRDLAGYAPITVVDNSSDSRVAEVAARHGATYDDPGRNCGFGAGVNRCLRTWLHGPPVDVLLVNPDAVLAGSHVITLQEFLYQRPDVGTVSPLLTSPEGRAQRASWPFPRPRSAWLEAVGLARLVPAEGFVVGAVLMIRWEALQDVGLFDERFFLYAEEADWQRRARLSGWAAEVCRDVTASHVGGGTSPDSWSREVLFHAGTETYIRKWFGTAGWISCRAAVLLGCVVRMLMPGPRRRSALTRAGIYARGPRRLAAQVRVA